MKRKPIKMIVFHILVMAAIAGAVLVYRRFLSGCPIRMFTGIPCPTCGMSRAAFALLRLDFAASLRYHPLLIPFMPALWFAIHKNLFHIGKKAKDGFLTGCAAVVFIVYIIRLFMGTIP